MAWSSEFIGIFLSKFIYSFTIERGLRIIGTLGMGEDLGRILMEVKTSDCRHLSLREQSSPPLSRYREFPDKDWERLPGSYFIFWLILIVDFHHFIDFLLTWAEPQTPFTDTGIYQYHRARSQLFSFSKLYFQNHDPLLSVFWLLYFQVRLRAKPA